MDIFGIFAIVLAVIGIVGGFLPLIPGPPLSAVALLMVFFSEKAADPLVLAALVIWAIAAVLLTVMDYVLPGMLAKAAGGHKAAERGATIGLLVGLFLTPVGMVVGSFAGAFIGEFLTEGQGFAASLKAAAGTFVAFIFTTGVKVIYSVLVLWQVLSHLFF